MGSTESAAQGAGKRQGRLTIFASYFSGAGKSYAMLKAGEQARQAGVDVAAGWLSRDAWPETRALAEQFRTLPRKSRAGDGEAEDGIDLDACLNDRAQLILIDELSHHNGETSRHGERYQDVEELLRAGVDVYTTLDVPHLESVQDAVSSVEEVPVAQRIPDRVFDQAARVEFIDIEPERLRQRLF